MMKWFVAVILCVVASAASALVITNPAPGDAGADISGSGLFSPDDALVGVEISDLGVLLAGGPFPAGGLGGAEFGFYLDSDPGSLITIFDSLDQDPDPGGSGSVVQSALVNFLSGQVIDVDAGVVQSTFPVGTGVDIGFYLTLSADFVSFFGLGFDTIFSEAALNPSSEDMMAAFPLLAADGFLLVFGIEHPTDPDLDPLQVGVNLVANVSASTSVPAPGTFMLTAFGLLILLRIRQMRPA
jgi:hypothetical protein